MLLWKMARLQVLPMVFFLNNLFYFAHFHTLKTGVILPELQQSFFLCFFFLRLLDDILPSEKKTIFNLGDLFWQSSDSVFLHIVIIERSACNIKQGRGDPASCLRRTGA